MKGYQYKRTSGYYGVNNYFKVKFDSNNIECSIYINCYKKIKRVQKDLTESLNLIEKEFLNLAEGRDYGVFKDKYYEILKKEISDEILKDFKKSLCFFHEISNKQDKASRGFIIINKDENDSVFIFYN